MADVLIIAGGIIPDSDKEDLEKIGVAGVFGPGTSTRDVIKFIEESA